ncbi:MAG: uroporphyrinogen-III synthase [Chitinophagaceae bacterium]
MAKAKKTTPTKAAAKKAPKPIQRILVGQLKPESDKSPYYDLARKHNVVLDFAPFINVEGVPAKDFRKQKVNIPDYTAVIFNSRNAIDHFFRICDELRIKVSADMKYFCIAESIAVYLQKFITYRKRKIFFGNDGSVHKMLDVIAKHKTKEKYLVPLNDICRTEILECLDKNKLEYAEICLYKTVINDVSRELSLNPDMIVFFTPGSVKSLFENNPEFKQNDTLLAAFGPLSSKAVEEAGLTLNLKAPLPGAPSMSSALDQFLSTYAKG